MAQKLTLADAHAVAHKHNGKCLSKAYLNCRQILQWRCDKNHTWPAVIREARSRWCSECRFEDNSRRRKEKEYKKILGIVKEKKGKILAGEYQDQNSKFKIQCNCGYKWSPSANSLMNGAWCRKCSQLKASKKRRKYTIKDAKKIGREKNFRCLSKEINSVDQSLKWVCIKCNYPFTTSLGNIIGNKSKKPTKCKRCIGAVKLGKEEIKKYLEKIDVDVIYESYQGNKVPLAYKKKCGCSQEQLLHVLRKYGPKLCHHDSKKKHQIFECLIRSHLNRGQKPNDWPRNLKPDVFCRNGLIIEVKYNKAACFYSYREGSRDPFKVVQDYLTECHKRNLRLYVVVNESKSNLTKLDPFYLGWEDWHKVGLNEDVVDAAQQLKFNNDLSLGSKAERKILEQFIKQSLLRGYVLFDKECKQEIGVSFAVIKKIAAGSHSGKKGELLAALRKIFQNVEWVQPFFKLPAVAAKILFRFNNEVLTAHALAKKLGFSYNIAWHLFKGKESVKINIPSSGRSSKKFKKEHRGMEIEILRGSSPQILPTTGNIENPLP